MQTVLERPETMVKNCRERWLDKLQPRPAQGYKVGPSGQWWRPEQLQKRLQLLLKLRLQRSIRYQERHSGKRATTVQRTQRQRRLARMVATGHMSREEES